MSGTDNKLSLCMEKMKEFEKKHGDIVIHPANIYATVGYVMAATKEYIDSMPDDRRQKLYERIRKTEGES